VDQLQKPLLNTIMDTDITDMIIMEIMPMKITQSINKVMIKSIDNRKL
jgi:hypothetical protein